uniref:Uncharacterized protein n=1 Tax=Glossina brevipalpis TaxID=37001 RepID=A0A1A9WWS1_9MUSC
MISLEAHWNWNNNLGCPLLLTCFLITVLSNIASAQHERLGLCPGFFLRRFITWAVDRSSIQFNHPLEFNIQLCNLHYNIHKKQLLPEILPFFFNLGCCYAHALTQSRKADQLTSPIIDNIKAENSPKSRGDDAVLSKRSPFDEGYANADFQDERLLLGFLISHPVKCLNLSVKSHCTKVKCRSLSVELHYPGFNSLLFSRINQFSICTL